jgi:class 3 adenylate cyclase/pimeloyl-ACP methyl ester carboxylesterase
MGSVPEPDLAVQYAVRDGAHIAYGLIGAAERHLVVLIDGFSPVDDYQTLPSAEHCLRRLSQLRTVVLVNFRGTGLSDPVLAGDAYPAAHADDVLAVMDAVGAHQVDLLTQGWPGNVAIRLAANHPERVHSMVLGHNAARQLRSDDHPFGLTEEEYTQFEEALASGRLSASDQLALIAPSAAADPEVAAWIDRSQRRSSPGQIRAGFAQGRRQDTRELLAQVTAPTLVLHRTGNAFVSIEAGRYLAEHIPGARFLELPGADHVLFLGEIEPFLDAVEEFLTGSRRGREVERRLVTLLFSDLVDSTGQAVSLGDQRWRDRLDRHDRITASVVGAHGGRVVKSTGDGCLATFDSPSAAVRAAQDLADRLDEAHLLARFGLHTGEVELRGNDVGGVAVHLAARVLHAAEGGEILVSAAVPPLLLGSGLAFEPRGSHELRGLPGRWDLFAVAR